MLGLVPIEILGQQRAVSELIERLEHHIRVDRRGAIADQRRHVVNLARLSGFDHQARAQACSPTNQVMVHGADGQQRWYRDALGSEITVRKNQDVGAVVDVAGGLLAQRLQPRLHSVRTLLDRPADIEGRGVEHVVGDLAKLLELVVAEDWLIHHQHVSLVGRLGEQVHLRSNTGLQAHHDRLANRVDRRVGDLCEQLLEI